MGHVAPTGGGAQRSIDTTAGQASDMGSLSRRVTAGVLYACALLALAAVAVGAVGIVGVRVASRAGTSIARDELATATVTANVAHQVDVTYSTGLVAVLSSSQAQRETATRTLVTETIPAVEASLASLRQIHIGDEPGEVAEITQLVAQWAVLRNVLTSGAPTGSGSAQSPTVRITLAYAALSDNLGALGLREVADAQADEAAAGAARTRTTWVIALAVAFAVAAAAILGFAGSRRLRRAVEPSQDQVEFADTLQLAEDEAEAHHLLKRHLERAVDGGVVTVLNRNNSADRLEAVTALAPASPLLASLHLAVPRSCLAVRSGRTHDEDAQRPALLGCPVCSSCPGRSVCTPLTVGGEVIGSVLVNRGPRFTTGEQQRVRDSVSQAAPVLANLRNLAIAELRAATDSLTGLPNKRAVGDTLKRMLGQASRTLSPLSLLLLDLDHFKSINDRFGHPVGDQALAHVGAALRASLRESDFAGRNGGEEFAVILPDTDLAGAFLTAEKIRAAIADISFPGVDLVITASGGVATYPDHATSTERLESLADSALYVAKRSGRNRVEVAIPTTDPTSDPTTDPTTDLVMPTAVDLLSRDR